MFEIENLKDYMNKPNGQEKIPTLESLIIEKDYNEESFLSGGKDFGALTIQFYKQTNSENPSLNEDAKMKITEIENGSKLPKKRYRSMSLNQAQVLKPKQASAKNRRNGGRHANSG